MKKQCVQIIFACITAGAQDLRIIFKTAVSFYISHWCNGYNIWSQRAIFMFEIRTVKKPNNNHGILQHIIVTKIIF